MPNNYFFIHRFDANGDGSISEKEMKKIIKDLSHLLDDKNSCKSLTKSAFKVNYVIKMFCKCDFKRFNKQLIADLKYIKEQ